MTKVHVKTSKRITYERVQRFTPGLVVRNGDYFCIAESQTNPSVQLEQVSQQKFDWVAYDKKLRVAERKPLTLAGFPDHLIINELRPFVYKGQTLCSMVVGDGYGARFACLARLDTPHANLSYIGMLQICGEDLQVMVAPYFYEHSGKLRLLLCSPPGYVEASMERFTDLEFTIVQREHLDLRPLLPREAWLNLQSSGIRAALRLDSTITLLLVALPAAVHGEFPTSGFVLRKQDRWSSTFFRLDTMPEELNVSGRGGSRPSVRGIFASSNDEIDIVTDGREGKLSNVRLNKARILAWPWIRIDNLSSKLSNRTWSPNSRQKTEQLVSAAEKYLAHDQPIRAAILCARHLSQLPGHASALNLLATVLHKYGDKYGALAIADRAVRLGLTDLQTWRQLAKALSKLSLYAQAAEVYRSALRYFPNDLSLIKSYALALVECHRRDDAIAFLHGYEKQYKDLDDFIKLYGDVLFRAGRFVEAAACFEKLIAKHSTETEPYVIERYIASLREADSLAKALQYCAEQLRNDPHNAGVLMQQAFCHEDRAEYEQALKSFDKAIANVPDPAGIRYNRAHANLILGRIEEGLADYDCRFYQDGLVENILGHHKLGLWDGSPMLDKKLLVIVGLGRGDAIQFSRYLPAVKRMVGELIVVGLPDLLPIFAALNCVDRLHDNSTDSVMTESADCYVLLESLPHLLGVTRETLDGNPYLDARFFSNDHELALTDADRFFKVGVCVQGNPLNFRDHHRSMALETLTDIQCIEGIKYFLLHKPMAKEDRTVDSRGHEWLIDCSGHIETLAHTAALIAHMDLVISVDTVVAHLAGAMGKPVWAMVCYNPHWIYMNGESICPWYQSMKVFRQTTPGRWDTVVQDIARGLNQLVKET